MQKHRPIIITIALALMVLGSISFYNTSNVIAINETAPIDQKVLSQAKEAANNFLEGNLTNIEPVGTTMRADGFNINFMDENKDIALAVNHKNQVVRYYLLNRHTAEVKLDTNECKAKALSFVKSKYEGFSERNMRLIESGIKDHGAIKEFNYLWREEKDGVLLPSHVRVGINPESGEVQSFAAKYSEKISELPVKKVSRQEAMDLALERVNISTAKVLSTDLDAHNKPGSSEIFLRWRVMVDKGEEKPYPTGSLVIIDASSGEIVDVAGW